MISIHQEDLHEVEVVLSIWFMDTFTIPLVQKNLDGKKEKGFIRRLWIVGGSVSFVFVAMTW